MIHSREAEDDTAAILEEEMEQGRVQAAAPLLLVQGELARRGLAIGAYVSFSGILTYKNAEDIRATARGGAARPAAGRNRRALSGAGSLSRQDQRAGLCRQDTGEAGGGQGRDADDMAEVTNGNFFRLFRKVPHPAGLR